MPDFNYSYRKGFIGAGNDLGTMNVSSTQEALDACNQIVECRCVTYSSDGPNGTITKPTKIFLKRGGGSSGGAPWSTWSKEGAATPPSAIYKLDGQGLPDLSLALRESSFTVQWFNVSGANYSFAPPLSAGSSLPLVQHLGDVTIRVRTATSSSATTSDPKWSFFSSAWGPFSADAIPVNNDSNSANTLAAHDITPLLEATNTSLSFYPPEWNKKSPLKVIRSYQRASGPGGFEISFNMTNVGTKAVEIGAFGMATPAGNGGSDGLKSSVANDAHMGGSHGWVEWVRIVEDEQCVLATPLNAESKFEAWRPMLEFGGGGWSWEVGGCYANI
jgi:hypothetical protein